MLHNYSISRIILTWNYKISVLRCVYYFLAISFLVRIFYGMVSLFLFLTRFYDAEAIRSSVYLYVKELSNISVNTNIG